MPENTRPTSDGLEPLTLAAHRLLGRLASDYDVTVSALPGYRHEGATVSEAVLVVPAEPHGASVLLAITTEPRVIVRAGVLHEFCFPPLGDETREDAASLIGQLEDLILTIVNGGYTETVDGDMVSFTLRHASGWQSGECHSGQFPPERVAEARATLAASPGGWAPWPRRPVDRP
ncbi:DUF6226 family protein [Lacisediminihabitans profunda]|uniref:Uncharacterized protein n=1 Tax=Lacisediminihabitans profunda TaxID=2594790 RepID=A0A5C8UTL9_9MICO|nr:DUF6226 family protein [Lacisediminihabitans profunda]TXN31963.1 hypothetical protein FVP33_03305 [Lacisediminihabitans profunda]